MDTVTTTQSTIAKVSDQVTKIAERRANKQPRFEFVWRQEIEEYEITVEVAKIVTICSPFEWVDIGFFLRRRF